MALRGIELIGCALLVVAGMAKAAVPGETAKAIGALVGGHVGALAGAVRALAAAEVAIGLGGIVQPDRLSGLLVGISYVVLAGTVGEIRRRGGALASCGCLGKEDTPASFVHIGINVALAAGALGFAAAPVRSWNPWVVGMAVVGFGVVWVAMTLAGPTEVARKRLGIAR